MDAAVVVGVGVAVAATLLYKPVSNWWSWKVIRQNLRGERRPELEAAWRGDLDRVVAVLGELDGIGTFRLACAELSGGEHEAALDRIGPLAEGSETAAVLVELIALRCTGSSAWLDDLVGAWRNAGAPDLRDDPWLNQDWERSFDRGTDDIEIGESDRALWEIVSFEPSMFRRRSHRAREWASDLEASGDLAELVIAAAAIYGDGSTRAQARYRQGIAKLCERAPHSFALRLARLSLRQRRGLARADLDAPDGDLGVTGEVFDRFVKACRARGCRSAELLALKGRNQSLILPEPELLTLFRSAPGEVGERAWHRALAIARRLLDSSYAVGVALGAAMLNDAAKYFEDRVLIREAEPLMAEARRLLTLRDTAPVDPFLWPIPQLTRECVEHARIDEIGYYRTLMGLEAGEPGDQP